MRRALGKGLSQLIAEQYDASPTEAALEDILPNSRQPRSIFGQAALEELAASIRQYGLIQPLVVRPLAEGKYELIAGERRLRAAKIAGLRSVPIVLRSAGNQSALEIALIENVQREDMNALECARSYRRLIDEFGMTQEQVADRVGKSRTAIANTLRLIRLPEAIQKGLEGGKISEGHARALLAFESPSRQTAVYEQILAQGLSVREVERLTQQQSSRQEPIEPPKPKPVADPNLRALEDEVSRRLSAPAKIQKTSGGAGGKLTVEFFDDDDLQRILDAIGISL
jgi:ParB family chromosome partitioning protein